MNKYSIITSIAIIAIAIPVIYSVWNIYSANSIQMRSSGDNFSYFDMSNKEKINVCNPNSFFVSFNWITIDVYYQNDLKGTFKIGPTTMAPNTNEVMDIDFKSDSFSEAQALFMTMDDEFSGVFPIRLMVNEMIVVETFNTSILGFIPYQTTITQPAFDFTKMMNEDTLCENSN